MSPSWGIVNQNLHLTHTHTHTDSHTHIYKYTDTHIHTLHIFTHSHIQSDTRTLIHKFTHIQSYAPIQTHMYSDSQNTSTYLLIHRYTLTLAHTRPHQQRHTFTPAHTILISTWPTMSKSPNFAQLLPVGIHSDPSSPCI